MGCVCGPRSAGGEGEALSEGLASAPPPFHLEAERRGVGRLQMCSCHSRRQREEQPLQSHDASRASLGVGGAGCPCVA